MTPAAMPTLARTLRQGVQEEHPELWSRIYPRVYNDIGGYGSPQDAATHMCEPLIAATWLGENTPPIHRALIAVAAELMKHNVPTYFVKRDLLDSLAATDYRDALDWVELELPHEAMLLMLPKGWLVTPEGHAMDWLVLARLTEGEEYHVPGIVPRTRFTNTSLVCGGVAWSVDTQAWYHYAINAKEAPTVRFAELPGTYASDTPMAVPELPGDDEFTRRMLTVALHVVLYMLALPDEVSRSKVVSRIKAKRDRPAKEFWSPNIVGFRYAIQREERAGGAGGEHASPRTHWRRGHWTRQAYGEGRKLRKTLWIRPVLVCAT